MEDQHTCVTAIAGLEGHAFFAVYDGHGAQGEKISEFISFEMVEVLEQDGQLLRDDPAEALRRAVGTVDQKLRQTMPKVVADNGARSFCWPHAARPSSHTLPLSLCPARGTHLISPRRRKHADRGGPAP